MPSKVPRHPKAMSVRSSHAKRLLTATVALPLLFFMVLEGGLVWFALLVALAAGLGLLEYYAIALPAEGRPIKLVGLILALAVIASFCSEDIMAICAVLSLAFVGSAVVCLRRFRPGASMANVLAGQVTGLVYVPFLLGHLILIREWTRGTLWVFFLLGLVFAGDTAAYYVGRTIGRHKLAPNISPGKTVEGAVGGLAASLLAGSLFKLNWLPEVSWGACAALMVIVTVSGQVGDLVQSMLKRSVGLKDSGSLLPGHGGMLDRIDSLLFAAPALFYAKTYLF